MQKLPEASDRKKGQHMRKKKKKGTSQQKEEDHSLSAGTSGVTSKSPSC